MTVKKLWFNMIINALSLLAFMSMISTGLIMRFILPPGSGRTDRLFSGSHYGGVLTYCGWSRHEWGEIHFWIALFFLILLVFHLVLHWSWIHAVAWGSSERPQSNMRRIITLCIISFILFALIFPWIFERP